ncbi:crossover junction endodeoxyribonuclease RuvC [Streptomyces sp. NPDC059696]|uniref:crossover junction endodeoxyribonuclease RuvC n=1 Tax=Streptomyces sp. NPDC059696 TaxID=3346911 RepID=UPI0036BBA00E
MTAPRVLALDLSITATGVCLPDGTTHTIATQQKTGDARLKEIERAITEATFDVDFAAIEDLPTHAKSAGVTGMVHGVARLVLLRYGIPYAVVTPATLKAYATGKGNADKTAMAIAALKRTGREFADDNQCDAWWLRAAALDWYGHAEFTMPQAQRDRLSKVTWPELAEVAS